MGTSDWGHFRSALAGGLVAALLLSTPAVSAAVGSVMKVGEVNVGNATTTLRGSSPGTLRLVNTRAAEEALSLTVASGPVMQVGNAVRIPNLNADRLDGLHAWQMRVPTGAVMFFDLATCPAGWTAYAPAQGRTVVGLTSGGTLEGTKGTPFTNLQSPTAEGHQHAWSVYYASGRSWKTWGQDGYEKLLVDYGSPPRETGATPTYAIAPHSTEVDANQVYYTASPGVISVHMPYVQLLACRKG